TRIPFIRIATAARASACSMPSMRSLPAARAIPGPSPRTGGARSRSAGASVTGARHERRPVPVHPILRRPRMSAEIKVPISPGELIDKITILEIKSARMTDAAKVANVRTELALLQVTWRESAFAQQDIEAEWQALRDINAKLWDIEDDIRDKERHRTF